MLAGDEEADAATDHCVAPASVVRESIQIRSRCDALVCVCVRVRLPGRNLASIVLWLFAGTAVTWQSKQ
jgi:hypothetical protein